MGDSSGLRVASQARGQEHRLGEKRQPGAN
jgi:hypothetical protein